jgi:hypothetical protein
VNGYSTGCAHEEGKRYRPYSHGQIATVPSATQVPVVMIAEFTSRQILDGLSGSHNAILLERSP